MSINIKQLADGSAGLEGTDGDVGSFIYVTVPYTSAAVTMMAVALPRRCILQSATISRVAAASNAVTATIVRAGNGTAIASGTAASDAVSMQGSLLQPISFVPVAAQADMAAGTRVGILISGALGAAGAGTITLAFTPA